MADRAGPFRLPEILTAERSGRAAVESSPPRPGSACHVVAECSPLGAAALVAARHAHNRGAHVRIHLLAPEADRCEAFAVMLEVCGCMDLPIGLWNEQAAALSPEAELLVGCVLPGAASLPCRRRFLEEFDSDAAWETHLPGEESALFLREIDASAPALSCAAIREIDRAAIEDYGLPGLCLMENAGIGAAAVARDLAARHPGRILVLAGRGNNGGDAFVVARGLIECGFEIDLVLLSPPDMLRGDAQAQFEILREGGVAWADCSATPETLCAQCEGAAFAVDGLLGTGLRGEVREPFRSAIAALNASGLPILALDIPSGLDGDEGVPLGNAIHAEATVTFAAAKTGLFRAEGPEHCGRVYLADIGAPCACLPQEYSAWRA